MGDKNDIIKNYAASAYTMANELLAQLNMLGDNLNINKGIISTAYIQITALNSQIVILQRELDNYEVV